MSALPILTNSRLKTARACQRLHRYQYGLGYRPVVEADSLRLGSLLHLGLEAWWRSGGDRLADALSALAGAEADPYDRAKVQALLVGYDARWLAHADLYEVIAVEAEFRCPLVNPVTGRESQTWQLGGKIDVIVREKATGRIGVCEHKSSSEDVGPGTTYWARLRMDPQVSLYFAGAEAVVGEPIAFCLYDVVKKPGQRPLTATAPEARKYTKDGALYKTQRLVDETPEEYRARVIDAIAAAPNDFYARGEVVRLDGEVAESLYDVWQVAQQLHEADKIGRYPRNPGNCLSYGRACSFLPVCSGETSLEDATLFRRTEIHPELNDAAEAA